MKTIAFDIMGNDNGIQASIEASIFFVKKHPNYKIILVGDKDKINKYLKIHKQIQIIDVKKVISNNDNILTSRNEKTSMSVAINLVHNKQADVVISSGNSGVYVSLCTIIFRRLANIKRPAFMPIFPTIIPNKWLLMLDVGANLNSTSEMLAQWAHLANVFSQKMLNVKKPKVAIINVGTEENKGQNFHKEAAKILEISKNINFYKFIEPRDLLNGIVDIAIIDGYAGNMILKSIEGASMAILKLLKKNIMSRFLYKIGAFICKGAFKKTKERLDYRNIGAAWVLGVNGLALKSHGGADKKSYLGALNQASIALEKNILKEFQGVLND